MYVCLAFVLMGAGTGLPIAWGAGGGNEDAQDGQPVNWRQMALIEARILGRLQRVPEAMRCFKALRQAYPADTEIREAYIFFLIEHGYYDLAQPELSELMEMEPANVRARRLQARLYTGQAQFGRSFSVLEHLSTLYPHDAGIWNDYAAARMDGGQWVDALHHYSRVLELDTDNRDARRAVHDILRQYGPRTVFDHRRYEQIADDTIIDTASLQMVRPVTEKSRLFIDYRYIDAKRPQGGGSTGVDGCLSDVLAGIRLQVDPRLTASAAIGGYGGAADGTSLMVKGGYQLAPGRDINAEYQVNRPWYDPVDAITLDGEYDRLRLSANWNVDSGTGLFLQGEDWRYSLQGAQSYGRRQTLLAVLSTRFFLPPELSIGYSYYQSWFRYAHDHPRYRPVAMVENQGWHSLFGTFSHRPCEYWFWGISAGWRYDHIRRMKGWFLQPSISLRLGNRMELDGGYEYASESTSTVGGETQTWNLSLRLFF